jgi:HD-like signal output (HDOD) protein
MAAGTVSAAEIADEIGKDQVLAAKVLKLVNNGSYGFRQPITTITHAMVLLGLDVVKTLVLTSSVVDMVDAMNQYMAGLWEHSVGTARAARALATRMKVDQPEEFGLAGLLHDLGKVIIAQTLPAEHQQIRDVVAARNCLQIEAELDVLGVAHPEIGMWLMKKWALPAKMVYPIAYHSNFHPRREYADRIAVVHVADIIARALGVGYPGDHRIPRVSPEAWAMLRLTSEDLAQVCSQVDDEMQDDLLAS